MFRMSVAIKFPNHQKNVMRFFSTGLFILCLVLLFLFFFPACEQSTEKDTKINDQTESAGINKNEEEVEDTGYIYNRIRELEYQDIYEPAKEPCGKPQIPPINYYPYETSWIMATFDDPDIPFHGLYAYYWIDWYSYNSCTYTAAFSVLYLKEGLLHNIRSSGGLFSDLDIHYYDKPDYHIFVFPYMRIRVDDENPFLFYMDLYGNGYSLQLEIKIAHTKYWSLQWLAYYDAKITRAEIKIDQETYHTTGRAILERWHSVGETDPLDAEFVQGYWLYEPIFWTSEDGEEATTLFYYWIGTDGYDTAIIMQEGILSRDLSQDRSFSVFVNYDYPENLDSKGYLRKHALWAEFLTGEEMYYEVTVEKEYFDTHHAFWSNKLPEADAVFLESHSYLSGTMEFEGKTYTGRGFFEWKSTLLNPLDYIDAPE